MLSTSGRAFSVKELAEQFGVSKPTIERDLATLEADFALIEQPAGTQRKAYRIDSQIKALDSITFLPMELLAVYAAVGAVQFTGTSFADDLHQVSAKIRGFLSTRHNGFLSALAGVFVPHHRGGIDYAEKSDLIYDLTDAVARRKVCTGTYHARWKDTVKTHRFRPLKMVWHRSALYLLCLLDEMSEITTLAVHRFVSVEVLDDDFPQPRIDVEGHVRRAFGIFVSDQEEDVEIVFDRDIAWRIEERTYHPDEVTERLADGRLIYRVRSSAKWEIVPWVLSFGELAELRRPQSWRESIAEALEGMRNRYGATGEVQAEPGKIPADT